MLGRRSTVYSVCEAVVQIAKRATRFFFRSGFEANSLSRLTGGIVEGIATRY